MYFHLRRFFQQFQFSTLDFFRSFAKCFFIMLFLISSSRSAWIFTRRRVALRETKAACSAISMWDRSHRLGYIVKMFQSSPDLHGLLLRSFFALLYESICAFSRLAGHCCSIVPMWETTALEKWRRQIIFKFHLQCAFRRVYIMHVYLQEKLI